MSAHPSPSAAAPKEPAAPPAVRVLVLNSGSSSVKYQLLDMRDGTRLAVGLVERIGEGTSLLRHTTRTTGETRERADTFADHDAALKAMAEELAVDGLGLDSPNWPPSATGWCTAGRPSPNRRSSTTRCSPRSSG